MPRASTVHAVIAIGIDMGKSTLHMVGLDSCGAIVLREKVSRGRIASRLVTLPPLITLDGKCGRWRKGPRGVSARPRPGSTCMSSTKTARLDHLRKAASQILW
jgi:hypothetical protein